MEQPLFFVQNADRAITSKDFKHLEPNQLRVHNQFYTLQGEGPTESQFNRGYNLPRDCDASEAYTRGSG